MPEIYPQLYREWLYNELILAYRVRVITSRLALAWSADLLNEVSTWLPNRAYNFLFDLSPPTVSLDWMALTEGDIFNVGVTRTGYAKYQDMVENRTRRRTRLALVLSESISGQIADAYSNGIHMGNQYSRLFFNVNEAESWLLGQNSQTVPQPKTDRVPRNQIRRAIAHLSRGSKQEIFGDREEIHMIVSGVAGSIDMRGRQYFTIGRQDETTTIPIELDLSDFGEEALSVSRNHARISIVNKRLYVTDLGSTNGTFLEGRKLRPNRPTLVYQDQVITVGKINITVLF
jgi:hypothetical protein